LWQCIVESSKFCVSPAVIFLLVFPKSTVLLPMWNVSTEALEAGQLSGLFKLTVLTAAIQLSPIVLVGRLLPDGIDDLRALNDKPFSGSAWGGAALLLVLFGSMIYTLAVTVLNIARPGWAGAS
jgi:hypothetical protein